MNTYPVRFIQIITFRLLALIVSAALLLGVQPSWAATVGLSNYPLYLVPKVHPNVLVVLDNSESMDGYLNGYMVSGDDPQTRGNVGRSVMRSTITAYRPAFNWGLMTFKTSGLTRYQIYNYYLGNTPTFDTSGNPTSGMAFTDNCSTASGQTDGAGNPLYTVGGANWSYTAQTFGAGQTALRCVPNPQPFTPGGKYVTFDFGGVDPYINDVLYMSPSTVTQYWARWGVSGCSGSTRFKFWDSYTSPGGTSDSTLWNPSNFSCPISSGLCGCLSLTPTDAGYIPSNPSMTPNPDIYPSAPAPTPVTRQVYAPVPPYSSTTSGLTYGFGYGDNVTGGGLLKAPVTDVSSNTSTSNTAFNTLMGYLGNETGLTTTPEIKNDAFHTPLAGTLGTALSYFKGSLSGQTSPVTATCQANFVVMVTDGLPTVNSSGSVYSSISTAQTDVYNQVTTLNTPQNIAVSGGGYNTKPIQTYVVGLGSTVSNPVASTTLNTMASDGGTNSAYMVTTATGFLAAMQSIVNDIIGKTSAAAAVSLNTGSLTTGSVTYQGRFDDDNWTGQLLAFSLNSSTGAIASTPSWDSAVTLNSQDYSSGRAILTYCNSTTPSICGLSTGSSPTGVPFRWPASGSPGIDPTEQTALETPAPGISASSSVALGQATLNYIRGDQSNEGTSGYGFRVRTRTCPGGGTTCNTGVLGDIVDSAPYFVGAPNFGYSDPAYATFASTYASREPMIYVGANDGMLHGFDATVGNSTSGQEIIAYVPSPVFANLNQLTTPTYSHLFYVDGSPTVGDAKIGGSSAAWKTVLVGGLNNGGMGYYALNVTDPSQFSEANASSLVMWEFTNATDPDMGYSYSQPSIVKMHCTGSQCACDQGSTTNCYRWAAVFGNGYNSAINTGSSDHAVLFIVFLDGYGSTIPGKWVLGTDYIKIDTKAGNSTTANGLSNPAVITIPTDPNGFADYIYAGDLLGNMWKFDVTSTNPASWQVAYGTSSTPKPLFTATDGTSSNAPQPIMDRPEVDINPDNVGGYMVYFGTGQYLNIGDLSTTNLQSFYGIWDNGIPVASRSTGSNAGQCTGTNSPTTSPNTKPLLQQCVTGTQTVTTTDTPPVTSNVRTTTNYPITWASGSGSTCGSGGSSGSCGWYMDLPTSGERQVTTPVLSEGRVIFNTTIPSSAVCSGGGTSWLMELSAENGSRLTVSPFTDMGAVTYTTSSGSATEFVSGQQSSAGLWSTPEILSSGLNSNPVSTGSAACQEWKFQSASNATITQIPESCSGNRQRQSWEQIY